MQGSGTDHGAHLRLFDDPSSSLTVRRTGRRSSAPSSGTSTPRTVRPVRSLPISSPRIAVRQADTFLRERGTSLEAATRGDLEAFLGDLLAHRKVSTAATYHKVLKILLQLAGRGSGDPGQPDGQDQEAIVPEQPVPTVPLEALKRSSRLAHPPPRHPDRGRPGAAQGGLGAVPGTALGRRPRPHLRRDAHQAPRPGTPAWIAAVRAEGLPGLTAFADSLTSDLDAVTRGG